MKKREIEEVIYEFTEEDIKIALKSFYNLKFPGDGVISFKTYTLNIAPSSCPPIYRGKAVFTYHKEANYESQIR